MTHTLSWYDAAQTTIHVVFSDGWTWDDVFETLNEVKRMMIAVPQQTLFTLLVDLSRTTTHPEHAEQYLGRVLADIPLRVQSVVVVSSDAWVRHMHATVIEVYDHLKDDWPLFETMREAEAYLRPRFTSAQIS